MNWFPRKVEGKWEGKGVGWVASNFRVGVIDPGRMREIGRRKETRRIKEKRVEVGWGDVGTFISFIYLISFFLDVK